MSAAHRGTRARVQPPRTRRIAAAAALLRTASPRRRRRHTRNNIVPTRATLVPIQPHLRSHQSNSLRWSRFRLACRLPSAGRWGVGLCRVLISLRSRNCIWLLQLSIATASWSSPHRVKSTFPHAAGRACSTRPAWGPAFPSRPVCRFGASSPPHSPAVLTRVGRLNTAAYFFLSASFLR